MVKLSLNSKIVKKNKVLDNRICFIALKSCKNIQINGILTSGIDAHITLLPRTVIYFCNLNPVPHLKQKCL
ncbi:unnamed protein product [Blepharisma stoltei]|uniref:Uncharacterized protein n=1 Tax=Blepharisma stoltei TaxID=1481888 RepID=A0AAU9IJ74_9CILI|nr:unnamed protein product [Blepharisma stoltei]